MSSDHDLPMASSSSFLDSAPPASDARSQARPDLPFGTPACCEGECVVRTKFIKELRPGPDHLHGARLSALKGSDLRSRFYCWHGAEGARYVCTIFSREQEAIVGEFMDVLVIGVARKDDDVRPICLMPSREFDTPTGRAARQRAHDLGCSEWHVYFNNDPIRVREFAAALGV